ncbi:MaoC family dehydratase [Rhodococcus sovatensis]|uniref:MaoC family dehydratase n=1 Tax=Rhodococcus sovatensis TaxID=1805840 RepID=A0ABZ2PLH5_9NOCA
MTILTLVELSRSAGTTFGPSEWMAIDQGRVDAYADAVGDRQWIHVDVGRARASPMGATIAHGNFTLALVTPMFDSLVSVQPCARILNYGYDKVRFLAPVRVGSRIRLTAELARVEQRTAASGEAGVLVAWKFTVASDDGTRPAVVAEKLQLFLF